MAETKADIRDVLVVHTLLRQMLDKLIGATERLDPAEAASIIPSRWGLYVRGLHHHHESEDHDFFPVIVAAAAQTEPLVTQLEAGGTSLEESLALWERGEKLARVCQDWLDGARKRLDAAIEADED